MRASAAEMSPARRDPPSSPGRVFIVALCGGADRPMAALGGRTCFESAATPHLDALARRGCSGLLEVIDPEIPPESDSGAMALLGYDPMVHYTGRGPLEGLGMDFWAADGSSVAFRVNFASWDPATGRLDRRTSRDLTDDELLALVAEIRRQVRLDRNVTFRLTGFGRHRGILALTSHTVPLSGQVANTDPGFVNRGPFGVPVSTPVNEPLPCRPLVADQAAADTAVLVDEFVRSSAEVLEHSPVNQARRAAGRRPANLVLVRDGGDTLPVLRGFSQRTGLRLSMHGQVPAERGLARLIGARFTESRPSHGQPDRDFYSELVPRLLADPAEAVFVHLKGPDEPGHDGQALHKTAAVEEIDASFIGPLVDALSPSDTLVITCDHSTPCELGIHAADRVPAMALGPGIHADEVAEFGEAAASRGGLAVDRASDLLPWLLQRRDAARP
jgi:2,3-bisphosphoglycerate-independent phosphoglycerate mutase